MIKTVSKSDINFYTGLLIFFPFVLLAFSGLFIQINYHAGDLPDKVAVLGLNRSGWLLIHKTASIISLVGITYHILLHNWWVKMLFTKAIKRTNTTFWLFVVFTATSATGLFSWLFLPSEAHSRFATIEIHDKIGVILTALFIFHLFGHWRWIVNKSINKFRGV